MTIIWLIRHGESTANAGQPTENPDDIPLTDLGHEQARLTSLAFERAPGLIITSKYRRAVQTGEYTQRRFPDVPVETWDIHEFTYLSPRELVGTNVEERRPLSLAYWQKCDPHFVHGPGAESFASFIARAAALQNGLCEQKHDFVAVFGHGFVMKALYWGNLTGAFDPTPDFMRGFHLFHRAFDLFNCAIIKMKIENGNVLTSGLLGDHLR